MTIGELGLVHVVSAHLKARELTGLTEGVTLAEGLIEKISEAVGRIIADKVMAAHHERHAYLQQSLCLLLAPISA
jgi:hypothetical protein